MRVQDIMTKQVITISPEESTAVAARLLSRYNVGALPVCDPDGYLRGMVTDRDIVLRCVAAEGEARKLPVKNIMTTRLVMIAPEKSLQDAATLMAREQVRRLPVAKDGRLVGMISLADIAVREDYTMEASEALGEICHNIHPKLF